VIRGRRSGAEAPGLSFWEPLALGSEEGLIECAPRRVTPLCRSLLAGMRVWNAVADSEGAVSKRHDLSPAPARAARRDCGGAAGFGQIRTPAPLGCWSYRHHSDKALKSEPSITNVSPLPSAPMT
jgi:hypothetical protein